MSSLPPNASIEERTFDAVKKLLAQKDELYSAVTKLFHQQELHETRTAAQFEKMEETLKGIHSRISKLEDDVENTGRFQIDDLKSQIETQKKESGLVRDHALRAIGGVLLLLLGAVVSWAVKK